MKVLIVGGVAGGASAAARLRRLDEHAEIILFERGEYISFANCGLPYYIGGVIENRAALALQTPESFKARNNVDVRVNSEVLSIDRAAKTVTVRTPDGNSYGESYDKLILAPGAAPIVPKFPGLDSDRVFTLRSIPDAYRIKRFIADESPKSAVIVGAGAIGLEMAENLVHAGIKVTMVELSDHAIAPLDADAASLVHACLAEKGVSLLLKTGFTGVSGQGPLKVELGSDSIQADMLILSIGVSPESSLARACGLDVGIRGHISVDSHMRTSDGDIYAVGDAVLVPDWLTGAKKNFALAGPANRQGRIAADHICGFDSFYDGAQGSSILKLFDMTVASTGLNEQTAKASGFDCDAVHLFSPSHAAYYPGGSMISGKIVFEKESGRLLGGQFMGTEGVDKRCDVLATAIRAKMSGLDLTRLELCYAPPFSSAKDPLNMAGFVIENILTHKMRNARWEDMDGLDRQTCVLLDVRMDEEHRNGNIPGALHIPLDSLRKRLPELDKNKAYYAFCLGGVRSYTAARILASNGYTCFSLSGGWHWYDSMQKGGAIAKLVW